MQPHSTIQHVLLPFLEIAAPKGQLMEVEGAYGQYLIIIAMVVLIVGKGIFKHITGREMHKDDLDK